MLAPGPSARCKGSAWRGVWGVWGGTLCQKCLGPLLTATPASSPDWGLHRDPRAKWFGAHSCVSPSPILYPRARDLLAGTLCPQSPVSCCLHSRWSVSQIQSHDISKSGRGSDLAKCVLWSGSVGRALDAEDKSQAEEVGAPGVGVSPSRHGCRAVGHLSRGEPSWGQVTCPLSTPPARSSDERTRTRAHTHTESDVGRKRRTSQALPAPLLPELGHESPQQETTRREGFESQNVLSLQYTHV